MVKLIICMLALCLSVIYRNNKWIFRFLFLMMFLLAAGDLTSPDKDAYRGYYINITTLNFHADVEIGFQLLIVGARALGLNFQQFILVYIGICFILLYKLLNGLSDNKAIALSLYMLFPFILDADQLRSYLGQLIVLVGIVGMVRSKKPNIIRYLCFVVVAMLFQESCAIFALYLLVLLDTKKVRKYILILSVALLAGRYLIPLIASHLTAFNLRKVADYFTNNAGKSTWFIYAIFYLVIILMTMYYTTRKSLGIRKQTDDLLYRGDFSLFDGTGNEVLLKINMISIALITLIPINPHFERLLRPVLMLDYITLTNMIGSRIRYKHEFVILATLLVLCLGRFATYLLGGGWDSYIAPLFFNGTIL